MDSDFVKANNSMKQIRIKFQNPFLFNVVDSIFTIEDDPRFWINLQSSEDNEIEQVLLLRLQTFIARKQFEEIQRLRKVNLSLTKQVKDVKDVKQLSTALKLITVNNGIGSTQAREADDEETQVNEESIIRGHETIIKEAATRQNYSEDMFSDYDRPLSPILFSRPLATSTQIDKEQIPKDVPSAIKLCGSDDDDTSQSLLSRRPINKVKSEKVTALQDKSNMSTTSVMSVKDKLLAETKNMLPTSVKNKRLASTGWIETNASKIEVKPIDKNDLAKKKKYGKKNIITLVNNDASQSLLSRRPINKVKSEKVTTPQNKSNVSRTSVKNKRLKSTGWIETNASKNQGKAIDKNDWAKKKNYEHANTSADIINLLSREARSQKSKNLVDVSTLGPDIYNGGERVVSTDDDVNYKNKKNEIQPSTSSFPQPSTPVEKQNTEVYDNDCTYFEPISAPVKPSTSTASSPTTTTTKTTGKRKYYESTMELIKNFDKYPIPKEPEPAYKYKPEVVRKKADKKKVPGYACDKCMEWYKGMTVSDEEMQKILDKCSKHRAKFAPQVNNTPPYYWDNDIPSTSQCKRLGLMLFGEPPPEFSEET